MAPTRSTPGPADAAPAAAAPADAPPAAAPADTPPAPDTPAAAAPADAAASAAPAEAAAKARRGGLRARIEADRAAADAQRQATLLHRLPVVLAVVAVLALGGWAAQPLALRALARRDSGGEWGTWAVQRLATLRDAGSFDLYVRELGRPEDHELYHRLVFLLGGRTALPEHEEGEILPEDPDAAVAHALVLAEGVESADPVARRGTLYALWVLKDRAWARSDGLLVGAADGLASDDAVTRRYAAMVLKSTPSHPAVQEALVRALATDADAVVRKNAVQGLANAGDPSRAPAVLAAIDDEDPDVRREAVLALARLGAPPPLDRLEELFRRDEPSRRAEVLEAIARHEGARATRLLLDGLRDPSPLTRRAAITGLGSRPGEEALEGLLAALKDAEPEVRVSAAAALSTRSDGRAAIPNLVAALPKHEGWGELNELHEALRTLTGAEIEGPGPDRESWQRVVRAWQQWLERGS